MFHVNLFFWPLIRWTASVILEVVSIQWNLTIIKITIIYTSWVSWIKRKLEKLFEQIFWLGWRFFKTFRQGFVDVSRVLTTLHKKWIFPLKISSVNVMLQDVGLWCSECSGCPIYIFLLKKIGFAPWPDIMLSQTIYCWQEMFASDVRQWSHPLKIVDNIIVILRSCFLLSDWLSFGDEGSFEIGSPKSSRWKNFGLRLTGGGGSWKLDNFLDVICVLSLVWL